MPGPPLSIFGGIGKLECAPFNAPDDPFPVYVDITPYARTESAALQDVRGRQTELDTIQSSQLTCTLDNGPAIPAFPAFIDTFTRNVSSTWSPADTGQSYTLSGGLASEYTVNGSQGLQAHNGTGVPHLATAGSFAGPVTMLGSVVAPALALTANFYGGLVVATGDPSNFYLLQLEFTPAGNVNLQLLARVGGNFSTLATAAAVAAYTAGTAVRVRFTLIPAAGTNIIYGKAWLVGGSEPGGYQVFDFDNTLPASGAIGCRSTLFGANATPFFVAFDDLSVTDPFTTSDRFTPGQTAGPFAAAWTTGRRVRYSETIGQRSFVPFTGYLEFPDVDSWQPIGYQEVQLSAVDRLTRLGRTPPFVSTLGEYIKLAGGASLIAYFPMNEAAGPDLHDISARATLTETVETVFGGTPATAGSMVQYAAGTALPGDEVQGVKYTAILDPFGAAVRWTKHKGALAATVAAGESLTIAGWINWTTATINGPFVLYMYGTTTQLALIRDSATGNYSVTVRDETSGNLVQNVGIPAYINAPTLAALRLTESSGLVECWIGSATPVTFTLPGAPSTAVFTTLEVGGFGPAAVYSHLQVYKGVGAYPRAMHLAQITNAYTGLEYQTAGQRVNTILDYAGVPAGERAIDPGVSFMQKASLAGQSAAGALAEAVGTERGRGFVAGDGRYVFHDRIRVLNV